ncbi:muscarinic acetylcholine receptor gar-3-like [Branchiostoma floridae]|uniref:Muscarinic acetylcholine receptor gar-3-like n=1 Tax=Branchiostoma floridae TaxID=7739 RepID=A0A9J7LAX2_BRAFL|nr:muscarinic acetylcholine receptor gar-3-like [Branchiostoma floridae]
MAMFPTNSSASNGTFPPALTRVPSFVTRTDPFVTRSHPFVTRTDPFVTRTDPAVTRLCLNVGQAQLERLVDELVAESKAHVTALLVLVCLLGTVGNLLVVLVSARRRKQSSATVCLTSLAAVDLLICGVFVPHKIYQIFHTTYTGAAWCKVNPYFMTAGLLGSTFLLDVIAVDRYRAVCRPLRYCTTKKRWTVAGCAGTVLLGAALSVPNLIGPAVLAGVPVGPACQTISICLLQEGVVQRQAFFVATAAIFFASVLMMVVLYAQVFLRVRASGRSIPGRSTIWTASAASVRPQQSDSTPRDSTPCDSTPRDSTPCDSTPCDSTPRESTPHDSTQCDSTSRDSKPRDSTPRDSTPCDSTPCDSTPRDSTPRDSTPRDRTLGDSTPRDSSPRDSTTDEKPNTQAPPRELTNNAVSQRKSDSTETSQRNSDSTLTPQPKTTSTLMPPLGSTKPLTPQRKSNNALTLPQMSDSPMVQRRSGIAMTSQFNNTLMPPISCTALAYQRNSFSIPRLVPPDRKDTPSAFLTTQHQFRVAKLLMLVTMVFMLSWLPYWSLTFYMWTNPTWLRDQHYVTKKVVDFFQHFYLVNHALNPIIYAFVQRDFRRGLADMLKVRVGVSGNRNKRSS